jgi:aspartate aminotransferase-like enzyme
MQTEKIQTRSYVFPGDIEEEIRQIAAEPIPYMRTADFSKLVKECEQMLLTLIHCTNGRVIPYTASGTGAMDAVVANYVSAVGKAFVIVGGSFGKRWKDLCNYYDCPCVTFEVPFARDINYEKLEAAIAEERPKVFLCQHHETSTGQLYNLQKISAICKKYGTRLVVDVISSFLADPLNMDEIGADICITSSQKGLNIAPGLSFLFLSERVKEMEFKHRGYYFDFAENLKNLLRGQTPYSPATTLFMQLHARLERNIQLGVDKIIDNVRAHALYFRSLCAKYGWEVPAEVPSNCITGFFVPRNGDILFTELMKKGIYIMPGGTPNYFRVSHLGVQSEKDLDELAAYIKEIEMR